MTDDNYDDDDYVQISPKFDRALDIYMTVISSFSTVGSSLVLLTGIMFPALRNREIYFQLILLMSFSDFCFSLVGSWGAVKTKAMCTIQAGFIQFFTTATWMFVLMLSVTIFCSFHFRRRYLNLWHMIAICWSVALLVTCLPLTNKYITYTSTQLMDLDASCTMWTDDDDLANYGAFILWVTVLTNVLPLTIIALMFGLCAFLYLVTLPRVAEEDPEMAQRMKRLVNYIVLYPIAMSITWGPLAIFSIWDYFKNGDILTGHLAYLNAVLVATFYIYGFIASLIFFLNASSAREMWRRWFVRNIGKRWCNMEEENDLLKDLTPEELDELDDHDIDIVQRTKEEENLDDGGGGDDDIERALSLTFSDYRGSVTRSSRSRSRSSYVSNISDTSVDKRHSRAVSLGARLSGQSTDTIPEDNEEAVHGTTSVTMNPIVSTLEEEEEGDEGFSL